MPAIQLEILKEQVEKLIRLFNQPDEFVRELHDLLGTYSNRSIYRPGRTIHPIRQINTYYTPSIIMREIEKGLKNKAVNDPDAAFNLIDNLWREDFSEFNTFAAFLLGLAPVQNPEPVLGRIGSWAQPTLAPYAMTALLESGAMRLRREKANEYLSLIQTWLDSTSMAGKKIGLQALYYLAMDNQFHDLPKIFTLIIPLIKQVPVGLQGELRQLLVVLIRRSPTETAYTLKQIVFLTPSQDTKRLLRKVLDELPDELRSKLRDLINNPDMDI